MTYARDHGAIATPVGTVAVEAQGDRLIAVRIGGSARAATSAATARALAQIDAWFAGERRTFDLPLAPAATAAAQAARDAMSAIPFGQTVTYGSLARRIGSGPRAVGQACARNPFPLIVPCHRVLPASERLGNYSGGEGPATKRMLIDFERGDARLI